MEQQKMEQNGTTKQNNKTEQQNRTTKIRARTNNKHKREPPNLPAPLISMFLVTRMLSRYT